MNRPEVFDLTKRFVALEKGRVRSLDVGRGFWQQLEQGALGPVKRLVSCWTVSEDWNHWEYCADGGDMVCLMSGAVEFELESADGRDRVALEQPAATLLFPAGTWYRAVVVEPAMLLFITPGEGNRQRAL